MRITNIVPGNLYIKYKPQKGSAAKSLDSVVDNIAEDKAQTVFSCSVKAASDDYLDTPEAKACQKTLLLFSPDDPSGISDIDDLDTLNEVGDDLNSIKDILTVASDKMTTDEDRQKLQKMLENSCRDIDRIGKNYMFKTLSAKAAAGKTFIENKKGAAEIKDQMDLLCEVTGGGRGAADVQCKALISYAGEDEEKFLEAKIDKFKLTDILHISGISALTKKAAKDSLESVNTAITGVEVQKEKIKSIIRKYVKKAKEKQKELLKTKAGSSSKTAKEMLKVFKTQMSKDKSSETLQNIYKSSFSAKA